MANIGDTYAITKLGIPLYGSSDRAAAKTLTYDKVTFVGNVRIINIAWADSSGRWYQPDYPGDKSNLIPLYAITGDLSKGQSYGIGWIRSDDNYSQTGIGGISVSLDNPEWSFTIKKSDPNSSYKITLSINGETIKTLTGSSNKISFWPSRSELDAIYRNIKATSGKLMLTIETFVGGQSIGSHQGSHMLTIPKSEYPRFQPEPSISFSDTYNGQVYADKTTVNFTATGVPSRGATVTKIIALLNGVPSATSYTSTLSSTLGPFTTEGLRTLEFILIDSRGLQAKATKSFSVGGYMKPSFDFMTAKRSDRDQTNVQVVAKGKFDGSINQTISYRISYKLSGSSSWQSTELRTANVDYSGNWNINEIIPKFDVGRVYDFKVTVVDSTGHVTEATQTIGTESIPFSLGKYGVGVGLVFDNDNPAELQVGTGGIDSKGPIKINGKSINLSGSDTSAKEINPGSDLNEFRTEGTYIFKNFANDPDGKPIFDSQINNSPVSSNSRFLLEVRTIISSMGVQILYSRASSSSSDAYFRSYNGTNFSDWQKLGNDTATAQPKSDIVDYMNKSYGGYILYSNGILHQWGRADLSNQTYSFDYHKPFSAPPMVQLTSSNSAGAWPLAQLDSATATTCKFRMLNGSTGQIYNGAYTIHWVAMGMG